jgi:hypothetical protein|tara:strand:+ start:54 stop:308 length:255 start_codon:yes stop_codon:yes gene_type:complete
MAREYTLTVETSENTREVPEGVAKDLYNATITNVATGQVIKIIDVVSTYDRDQWCKTVFENAKEGLDHEDGPSCCYVNASYVVD